MTPIRYLVLVVATSLPFWALGALTSDATAWLPVDLPISALMFLCPLAVAVVLTRADGGSARALLTRGAAVGRVPSRWWVPALVIAPAVTLAAWLLSPWWGTPAGSATPWTALPAFVAVYLISAWCEEVGWCGYALDSLQRRLGARLAAVTLGLVWGGWHAVPYLQADRDWTWICWQIAASVAWRVILHWIYNGAGGAVAAAVVFHATINVAWSMYPAYGSDYDPMVVALLAWAVAAVLLAAGYRRVPAGPLPERRQDTLT